ncbi:MAG: hypothetical protein H6585_05330 [Flavobacteriales bacterium]|nr:hypothetical protein [Flavobacteriales bacterium]MCB9447751.1 hypothetical protein [Flavobacteriales bacterium]
MMKVAARSISIALITCPFLFFSPPTEAQNDQNFGLKDPGVLEEVVCAPIIKVLQQFPVEEQYSLQVEDGKVVFMMTDVKAFDALFAEDSTGLAVDIVTKEQFACQGEPNFANSYVHKGTLMKPLYGKELRAKKTQDAKGVVRVELGPLPAAFSDKELELNLLLLQKRSLCHYSLFYRLPYLKWDLLSMGLYRDTLPPPAYVKEATGKKWEVVSTKQLTFVVPFQKDRYDYRPEDIKPLYDSLRLSDYVIRKMDVQAYSSVEGPTDRNIMLQNKRAESMVKALEQLQHHDIQPTVKAMENWVEFFRDVEKTPYASMAKLSKPEIKEKFKDDKVEQDLEPMLAKHRKAIIRLEMDRKTHYEDMNAASLKEAFKAAIKRHDRAEAIALQAAIYSKISNQELPENFIESVEMPMTAEYGSLHANRAAFRFEMHPEELDTALATFERLQMLLPEDAHVSYNLSVLQLMAWLKDDNRVDPNKLSTQITRLSARGIDKTLVKRLLINFHMIETDYLMRKKDYTAKNTSIHFVQDNYRFLDLSHSDRFNLSKYFSNYAQFDLAVRILHEYVQQIGAHEEPLFFYLNLTIINPERTHHKIYRSILLNAINTDRDRFCDMFRSNLNGGITFQLLGDDKLRQTYCENCH